jgi:Ser/Thr protein kinase RdoA (MazF antagonist)
MNDAKEFTRLDGGGSNAVYRSGNVMRRRAGPWSPRVHEFLGFLEQSGFRSVPEVVGFDEQGNELLTFIPGEVGNYPLSDSIRSEQALVSAAKLLRQLHDCSVDFIANRMTEWMFPAREPVEVICHGDFAPYNCVFNKGEAIGIIDFDTAHPGSRQWDLAYALYRFAPMTSPTNRDGFGNLQDQLRRSRQFCDSYGLPNEERRLLPASVIYRLRTLIEFIRSQALRGNSSCQKNVEAGHIEKYEGDIAYIELHREEFANHLCAKARTLEH